MTDAGSRPVSRRTVLMGMAAAFALPLLGCTTATTPEQLRLAAGESGGLYLQFGELLRDALANRGGLEMEVLITNGSLDNLAQLEDRSAQLAIALADSAIDALGNGTDLVALGRVYQNYLQCVVRADSEIHTLDDLRGRNVSIGATGSGSVLTTTRLLVANQLFEADNPPIVSEHPIDKATTALRAGEIDAFFWSGGVPTDSIDALQTTTPIRLLDLSDAFDALNSAYPDIYSRTEVPSGVYGSTAPTPTVGIANFLLARPDLPDSAAEAIVDVLVRDSAALVPPGTAGVQYLTFAALIDTAPVPLHEAAVRRYRALYG